MELRSAFFGIALGSLLLLLFAFVSLRSSCYSAPAHLTDLNSLLDLMREWERHSENAVMAESVSRVADDLAAAIAAVRAARTPPSPALSPPASLSAANILETEQAALRVLTLAGTQCHVSWHTEHWGDTVVWGSVHHTHGAAECCAACAAHQRAAARGGLDTGINSTSCNIWVYCGDAARCGPHYQECWLKNLAVLPPPSQSATDSMWTSGVVYPGDDGWLAPYESKKTLMLRFELGIVQVELLPDLAPRSVREVRRLAALLAGSGGECGGCRVYRVETNFLVQGVLGHPGAYVATPRNPNPPQKKLMERGLVCWAGCAGGPDFFVNLIDQAGFGDCHLCWGRVTDMALFDAIVQRPTKPKAKPSDMTFLAHELRFNVTLS